MITEKIVAQYLSLQPSPPQQYMQLHDQYIDDAYNENDWSFEQYFTQKQVNLFKPESDWSWAIFYPKTSKSIQILKNRD